ncbi:molybdenum ABC transporter ATP-binding protein [Aestuariivirga litoralis]|uniref:Molybdenum ABC transporter ATP-binding protein n=1 Tax=Aestuariivirga litoralis TaxID=2650924 RepID=A0A2W2AK82_9HYPH|nr:molybdenum ABC transporter ATP-binding protein [Aestuariivirga litoralis]PZF75915.1 molybdenum ABC transporter ATP-binding protein [Aestuariivirga litoralis]
MSLTVDVRHRLGSLDLAAAFDSEGGITAVFGASGCGKTTLVNVIAGLIRPDHARITVGGTVLTDTTQGIELAPHRRRIGYVFQEARLFPHLTVEGNLAYGEWFTPRAERYAAKPQILDLLGIAPLLKRRPRDLSGGEKQRVAIGRALLASPRLLLMDEPLASLDQARKAEILPYIERLRDEVRIPIVYVSHSVAEVMRLASDVAVLAAGRLAAFGPAAEIAQRLDLIPDEERDEGGAIIDMAVAAHDEAFGLTRLSSSAGDIFVPGRIGPAGTPARVRIRARDVMLALEEPVKISALNILRGTVAEMSPAGPSSVNVRLDCGGAAVVARITRHSATALCLAPGTPAYAVVKAVSVSGPDAEAR